MKKVLVAGVLLAGLVSFQTSSASKASLRKSAAPLEIWHTTQACLTTNPAGNPVIGIKCTTTIGTECTTSTLCH